MSDFEQELLDGDWQEISGRPGIKVQLIEPGQERCVLAHSTARASKERAMHRR